MNNEKIAEELLAQTRTPQEAYEYAIRREKGIEPSRTMKVNPIGGQAARPPNKYQYITLTHVADKINNTTRTINEVGKIFATEHIHVVLKTQRVSNINNNETQIPNNVSSVEINLVRIIYNLARQKVKLPI